MRDVGVGVITCNREDFYKNCIDSVLDIPDIVTVVVNDGDEFKNISPKYRPEKYFQNKTNMGVGVSKNIALKYLLQQGCEHIFLLEDDITIIDKSVFDQYINASRVTGIKHLNFCLHGEDNKLNGHPNPRIIIDYDDIQLSLYLNVYGALTYYHRDVLESIGLMDEEYFNAMEHVDHTMSAIQAGFHPAFRWFADISNSGSLIKEQDRAHKSSTIRDKKEWAEQLKVGVNRFKNKFNIDVCDPHEKMAIKEDVIKYLQRIKP